MSNQLEQILSMFGQNEISALSQQVGAQPAETANALQTAIPTLLNALNNNAQNGQASGILAALDRDHDGSILDDIMGFVSGGGNNDGNGILKHLLGDNRLQVENAISQNSGISSGSISKLLPLIAPVIMGFLGKQKREGGVSDAGGLTSLIGSLAGGKGGLDIGSLIGMFTNNNNSQQTQQSSGGIGGILSIVSKLFGRK